jgi:hypothetical protein
MFKFYQTNDLDYICEELDRIYKISINHTEDEEEAARFRMESAYFRHLLDYADKIALEWLRSEENMQ